MIIDCDACVAQHTPACQDCIVTALCDDRSVLELAKDERAAIDAMSDAGLIAPIRLVVDRGDRSDVAHGGG
jgi:pyrimidine operon attenuation protein/uracil phosphoribosyltransferase